MDKKRPLKIWTPKIRPRQDPKFQKRFKFGGVGRCVSLSSTDLMGERVLRLVVRLRISVVSKITNLWRYQQALGTNLYSSWEPHFVVFCTVLNEQAYLLFRSLFGFFCSQIITTYFGCITFLPSIFIRFWIKIYSCPSKSWVLWQALTLIILWGLHGWSCYLPRSLILMLGSMPFGFFSSFNFIFFWFSALWPIIYFCVVFRYNRNFAFVVLSCFIIL